MKLLIEKQEHLNKLMMTKKAYNKKWKKKNIILKVG
jgi:hypothetical protein